MNVNANRGERVERDERDVRTSEGGGRGSKAGHRKSRAHTGSPGLRGEAPSYCSKRMFRRSPLLMRTMQSFSWKRPCCSAFPPLSRRLTNKPRVLKRAETSVSEAPWVHKHVWFLCRDGSDAGVEDTRIPAPPPPGLNTDGAITAWMC